jgi:cobalt/nickel transport system permease protein
MYHLHELFSTDGPPDCRATARCDVRVRLIVALAATVAVVMSTCIWFGLVALACCVVGLAALGTSPKTFASRLLGPAALATVIFLTRALMTGTTPLWSIELGPWPLTATREGVLGGALIACRVLGSVGIVMLLCQTTPAQELLAALSWARVPHTWIEIAALMYRYLYILLEQAASVVSAQRVRLGYRGLRRSFQSAGSLAGIVILRSLDQAERSHEAMIARGYRGRLPLARLPALPPRQWMLAASGVMIVATAYLLAARWPL